MAQSKNGYVPPSIQRQMDQHLQRMPANLQKYQSGTTYIPSHAAKSMESYMQKSMPAHMKEYIAPYMQQKVTAGLNSLDPGTTRTLQPRAPIPNLMRRDHSGFGEQFTVNVPAKNQSRDHKSLSFAPQYSPTQNNTPSVPPPAPAPGGGQNPYDFIMDTKHPGKKSILGGGSLKTRILIVALGGGLLVIAAFVVIALLSSGSNGQVNALVNLAEQENEIVRIAEIGTQKATSTSAKNFAITAMLSVQTDQSDTLSLLKKSGHNVNTNTLGLLKSSQTDTTLADAETSNNFDSTFVSLLKSKITNYRTAIQNAYGSSTSSGERQLLKTSFDNSTVLLGDQSRS